MSVVIGHDGSESGDDAAALGAQLARASGETPIVVAVYPEENPIGPGRVDAEWVAYVRARFDEVLAGARQSCSSAECMPSTASSNPARPRTGSTTSRRPRARR